MFRVDYWRYRSHSRNARSEEYRRCSYSYEFAVHDTPDEAAEGVKAFHPKVVYPYHYMGSDTKAFAKALEGTGIDVRLRDWCAK